MAPTSRSIPSFAFDEAHFPSWPRVGRHVAVVVGVLALLAIGRIALIAKWMRVDANITAQVATLGDLRTTHRRLVGLQVEAMTPSARSQRARDSVAHYAARLDSMQRALVRPRRASDLVHVPVSSAAGSVELSARLASQQVAALARGDTAAARRIVSVAEGVSLPVEFALDRAIRALVREGERRVGLTIRGAFAVAVFTLVVLAALWRWTILPALRASHRAFEQADGARLQLAAIAAERTLATSIVQSNSDGIVALNREFRITEWNPTMERWLGIDRSGAIGRHIDDILPVEDRTERREAMLRCLVTKVGYSRERSYHVSATGLALTVETIVLPLVSVENDEVVGVLCTIRNVGERHEAAAALRDSEARSQAVVQNAANVIIGMRADSTVYEWNAAAESLFGISREAALGRRYVDEILWEPWRSLVRAQLDEILAGGEVRDFPTSFVHPSRGPVVLVWTATRVVDAKGATSGIIAVGSDVTELHAADERFRILFDANTDGHLIFTESGIVDCNVAVLRLLGASDKSELLGIHPAAFSPACQPDGRNSMEKGAEMIALAVADGSHRFEWMHEAFDKTPLPMEVTLTRVHIRGVSTLLCVWHDLRPRLQADEAVRRERERTTEALNVLDSGFMLFDAEERLVAVNTSIARFLPPGTPRVPLGSALPDMLRTMLVDGRHPVTGEDGETYVAQALARHRGAGEVFEDHLAVPLRGSVARLSDGGSAVLFTDISEQKAVQASLERARDAARAADLAKSDFLARMSHELRTPLNSIIGFSRQVRRSSADRLTDREGMYLDRVVHNGTHLLAIINDILDLSKVEAGHLETNLAPTDVGQLVRETVALLEGQPRRAEVALTAEIPGGLDLVVTDGEQLRRVLINLLSNALKFTHRGRVHVSVESNDDHRPVAIHVEDSGIGIPADRKDAIFGAFEQAEASTSRRYGGTGLGLSICRSVCAHLGMTLEVESTVDVGSTFTVRFPMAA